MTKDSGQSPGQNPTGDTPVERAPSRHLPDPAPAWEVKVKRRYRSGVVTGARVVLYLIQKAKVSQEPTTVAQVAGHLDLQEGYVRRVLETLAREHVLSRRLATQMGTPPVAVYRLAKRVANATAGAPLGETTSEGKEKR